MHANTCVNLLCTSTKLFVISKSPESYDDVTGDCNTAIIYENDIDFAEIMVIDNPKVAYFLILYLILL
jgi:hypothetical protein